MKFKNLINDIVNLSWVNVSAALYLLFVLLDKANFSVNERSELDKLLFLLGVCGSVEYYWYRASKSFVFPNECSSELLIDLWSMISNSIILMLSIFFIISLLRVQLDPVLVMKCVVFTLTSLILSSYRVIYEASQLTYGEISLLHRIERLFNMSMRVFGFFFLTELEHLIFFIILNVLSCLVVHIMYRTKLCNWQLIILNKEKNFTNILHVLRPALLFFLNGFLGVFDRGLALTSNSIYAPAFFVASLFSRRSTIILEANLASTNSNSLQNYTFSRRSIIQTALLISGLVLITVASAPVGSTLFSVNMFFLLASIYLLTFFFTGPKIEHLISENSIFPIFLALAQFFVIIFGILLIRDDDGVDIKYILVFMIIKAIVQIFLTRRFSKWVKKSINSAWSKRLCDYL